MGEQLRVLWLRHSGIASTSAREKLAYRFDFFVQTLWALTTAGLLYSLWSAVYRNATGLALPLDALLTYVCLGQIFNFTRLAQVQRRIIQRVTGNIHSGNIAYDLLRPVDYQAMQFSDALGLFLSEMVLANLPAYLVAVALFGIDAPTSPLAGLGFAVSIFCAFLLNFSLDFLVNILAFWTYGTTGAMYAKKALVDLLAGSLVPLALFPDWLRGIAMVLPFAGIANTPLSIYIGATVGAGIWWGIAQQLLWALAMALLTRLVWLRAVRRVAIQGG